MGWEDVEEAAGAAPGGGQQQQQAEAEHWRARAARRQRYWSLSHGFKLGSKLGDWSKGDREAAAEPADGGGAEEGGAEEGDEGGGSARKRGLLGACGRCRRLCATSKHCVASMAPD